MNLIWLDDVNERARAIGLSILRSDAKKAAEVVVEVLSAPADDKYGHLVPSGPVFTLKADRARQLGYQLMGVADEAERSDYRRIENAKFALLGVPSDSHLHDVVGPLADKLQEIMQRINDGEL